MDDFSRNPDLIGNADTAVSPDTRMKWLCDTFYNANAAINKYMVQGSRGGVNTRYKIADDFNYTPEIRHQAMLLGKKANPLYLREGQMGYDEIHKLLVKLKDVPLLKAYAEDPSPRTNPDSFYIAEDHEFCPAPARHKLAPKGHYFVYDSLLKSFEAHEPEWRAMIEERLLVNQPDKATGFGSPGS